MDPVLQKISDLTQAELQQELGISPMIFLDSVASHTVSDIFFLTQLQDFETRFIRRSLTLENKPGGSPPMDSEDYITKTIAYVKECKNLPRDRAKRGFARRIYVGDRLFQETGIAMRSIEARLNLQDGDTKRQFAEFTTSLNLDFN